MSSLGFYFNSLHEVAYNSTIITDSIEQVANTELIDAVALGSEANKATAELSDHTEHIKSSVEAAKDSS